MVQYQILENKIIVFLNGQLFSIPKEDARFDSIKNKLPNVSIKDFVQDTLPEGFSYKNNSLYFHKFQIPESIEKFFKNENSIKPYLNLFLNAYTRLTKEEMILLIKDLDSKKIIPLIEDASLCFTHELKYDISQFSQSTKIKKPITDLLNRKDLFQENPYSKKELMKAIKDFCERINSYDVLEFVLKITSWTTLDERVGFLRKDFEFFNHPEMRQPLENLLKDFAYKEGKFQFKRAENLLSFTGLLDLVAKHHECKLSKVEFNYENLSLPELCGIVNKEYEKLGNNFTLGVEYNFPEISAINGKTFKINNENYRIEIPQFSKDLVVYGSILSNCVGNGSYFSKSRVGHSFILGLYRNESLFASIQVDRKFKIIQFESKTGYKIQHKSGDPILDKVQDLIEEIVEKL